MTKRLTADEKQARAVARYVKRHGVTDCPPSHDEEGVMRRRRTRHKRMPKEHESSATLKRVAGDSGGTTKRQGASMSQRYKIHVPLGDAAHADEEKGTTKVVRRTLTDLKGRAGGRTAVVYWRGQYHAVKENADGFFDCQKVVKEPEDAPRATNPDLTKGNGGGRKRKAAAKKKTTTKKANGNGAKVAAKPEADGGTKARRKPAKKAATKSAKRRAA